MSAAGSSRSSPNDFSSPRQTARSKLTDRRSSNSASPDAEACDRGGDLHLGRDGGTPLWVSLPAVQDLFTAAVPASSASQSVSMISWLKFCSDHSRFLPALAALNKTDFITIFLDTKRGAVGADAHELSVADFSSCLIALADRSNMISISSSPGRHAASLAPSSELLSVMSSFTSSLLPSKDAASSLSATPPAQLGAVAASSASPVSSGDSAHISDGDAAPLGTPITTSGAPDISGQVLQLLHRFYEFYSNGAPRLSHDNYIHCLVELQALQSVDAASGDATQIFFKFAATPDRGLTQEQFVDSFVHLAHVSAPDAPLHSSLHSLVVLGMGGHFSRCQERQHLREVLESSTVGELLKETQPFCEVAFRTCSGGKSILNIAQVNRWLAALKLQTSPSQTDIIRVFRDILRLQAARGSSSVGLDASGFQSFLLQLAVIPLQASQLTPSNTSSSFLSLLKHMGWGESDISHDAVHPLASPLHAPSSTASGHREAKGSVALISPAPLPLLASNSPHRNIPATHADGSFSCFSAPPVTDAESTPIPAGISISLTKSAGSNVAASVGADVLTHLADLDQPSAFAELQRIYTDKQVLVVQRKKELQAELEAWTSAEYEAAELKYKEQAVFRPTPALQDRERALQVLLSNANKTHPDELRRQQQIVEAFASKERQAWRFRCDVYSSTVRSRVKMAVDVKKSRLADTLRSMQIQLEVNMKKDFEALSKRFSGKSIFLRSSGPAPHSNDKFNAQPQSQTHQSAATTPRLISAVSSHPSAASRSQSAPRKHAPSAASTRDSDGQDQSHKPSKGVQRERPQSSMPTMSRRKSVLQEMEEAYLKAASRTEPRKAPLPSEARGRPASSSTPRNSGQRSASVLSDASDSRSRGKSAVWGGSSSNISNIQSRLNQMSDDEEAAVVDDNEHVRQDRLRSRMQSRSARAKPWLAKSPTPLTSSTWSNRAASAGDRSQLASDILNEDRVALAARLRDPGDDPPPNYFREPTAAEDEPLNVSRPYGGKPNARDSNYDIGQVIGVSEPEEWREICTLQTEWLGACVKISRFLISMQS